MGNEAKLRKAMKLVDEVSTAKTKEYDRLKEMDGDSGLDLEFAIGRLEAALVDLNAALEGDIY